jgi:TetR/AcrR family transcriptional regulator
MEMAVRRRRPRASAVQKRKAILDAALTVLSTHGYEGTTTRAIAKEAGLAPGHLSKYFPSKEALWRSVIEEFNRELHAILDATADTPGSPRALARSILPRVLRFFAVNHRLTRLMLQEFSISSPRHDWVVEQVGLPVWHRLRPLFEALHAGTSVNENLSAAFGYFALMGSALVFFGSSPEVRAIAGINPDDSATMEQYIEYVIDTLFGKQARR